MRKSKKLAIIGGGAAGYFCAANLAEQNVSEKLSVTIFEYLSDPMQKLLATGGGRCNLTNNILDTKELAKNYPRGEKFLYSVFFQFSAQDTINWFENRGIKIYTDNINCVFPVSDNAGSIYDLLQRSVKKAGFEIKNSTEVSDITYQDGKYRIVSNNVLSDYDYILICTGGNKSIKPKLKNINGYKLSEKLNHKIITPKPALAAITSKDKSLSELAGINLKNIEVSAIQSGKKLASFKDDLLFTHKGLSGPVILNLTSLIAYANFNKNNPIDFHINFTKYKNISDAENHLKEAFLSKQNKNVYNILGEICPKNIIKFILKKLDIDLEKKAHSITKLERKNIVKNLIEFKVSEINIDESTAMATAGGVSLKEVKANTMESKLLPGLFFAGEILDIDGFCGGYNLQFAWSSSYIAAKNILELLNSN